MHNKNIFSLHILKWFFKLQKLFAWLTSFILLYSAFSNKKEKKKIRLDNRKNYKIARLKYARY